MKKSKISLCELFRFICTYQKSHGYPPSLREMAVQFKVGSTATIMKHLRFMERQGWISI